MAHVPRYEYLSSHPRGTYTENKLNSWLSQYKVLMSTAPIHTTPSPSIRSSRCWLLPTKLFFDRTAPTTCTTTFLSNPQSQPSNNACRHLSYHLLPRLLYVSVFRDFARV